MFCKNTLTANFCVVHVWLWKDFWTESIMLLLLGYQVVQLTLFLAVLFDGFLVALQNILKAFSFRGLEKQKAVSVRMAAGKESSELLLDCQGFPIGKESENLGELLAVILELESNGAASLGCCCGLWLLTPSLTPSGELQ